MWTLKIPFVSMSHTQSLSRHVIYVVIYGWNLFRFRQQKHLVSLRRKNTSLTRRSTHGCFFRHLDHSHVWPETLPQLASLFGVFVQVLLRWVGHFLCLILMQMHLHRSLRKAHCMIQMLKGTFYVCMRCKGMWKSISVWLAANETRLGLHRRGWKENLNT